MAQSACREVKSGAQSVPEQQIRQNCSPAMLFRLRSSAHMGPMMDRSGALVLFSGGQDSTVCLGWALDRFDRVETVGFDYGQRHKVELAARDAVRSRMAAEFPA